MLPIKHMFFESAEWSIFVCAIDDLLCLIVSAREKDLAGWNGQASSEFHRIEKEPYNEPQATPMA